jgi:hypothetical protein
MDIRGKLYDRRFTPGDILDAATKRNISGPEENRTLIRES